jgi:cold-inducible RNA-binding protein
MTKFICFACWEMAKSALRDIRKCLGPRGAPDGVRVRRRWAEWTIHQLGSEGVRGKRRLPRQSGLFGSSIARSFELNIYVGNLAFGTTDDGLRGAFEEFGTVDSASVITDRETGRSRGFGFVEMPDAEEAKAAIEGTNGLDLDGRQLNVNEARPREDRGSGGGGGGRRGGGGGGGGGGGRW